jgi:prephenate dehydrogenase
MRVAVLGFGLIGGSIARALQERQSGWAVAAWSPSGEGPSAARRAGSIEVAAPSATDAVRGAELIILAAPPLATLGLIDQLGGPLRAELTDDVVVTDVASTKTKIVDRAATAGLRFVGGHPMAGSEEAGFGAARADLFVDRPWVIVDPVPADETARDLVEMLALACGARPVTMSAAEHDSAVAAISHLPLVLSAALVEAVAGSGRGPSRPDWPAAADLASTGWHGMTRLARGDVEMGAGIAATNAPAIAARVRDLRAVLDAWLVDLERPNEPDATAVAERLAAAQARLETET